MRRISAAGLLGGYALSALIGCSGEQPLRAARFAPEATLVIQDVAVFAAVGEQRVEHQDVWVDGGVVSAITPAGEQAAGPGVVAISGVGRTLLPGLIDAHVHLGSGSTPPWKMTLPDPRLNATKFLYAGVTTVYDLGGHLPTLKALSSELRAGALAGPDLYFTGPHVAIAHGHPQPLVEILAPWPLSRLMLDHLTFAVEDKADVVDAVAQVKDAGGSMVKITVDEIPLGAPKLEGDLLKFAADQAHAQGFKVMAHVGSEANAMAALDVGVDMMAHGVYRGQLSEAGAARIAAAGVPVAATIGVFHKLDRLTHEGYARAPLDTELMDPETLAALEAVPEGWSIPEVVPWLDGVHNDRAQRFANARLMGAQGVTVLVGSDSPTIGQEAGAATHWELDLMVQAGYPPAEVLRRATAVNAQALGFYDRGTVEVGKRADLLLVEGDPTQDIAAVHRIAEVVAAGRRIERVQPYEAR